MIIIWIFNHLSEQKIKYVYMYIITRARELKKIKEQKNTSFN